jgi:hypothetical protein
MKRLRAGLLVASREVLFLFVGLPLSLGLGYGCDAIGHNSDPTPALKSEIESAGAKVVSADSKLAQTPPRVPEARADLKEANTHISNAINETDNVSRKFNEVEAKRVADEQQIKRLNEQWWSPRQKRCAFWIGLALVVIGILAAVGNYYPGWWSWLPWAAIKVARLVLFAGIPHVIDLIVAIFKRLFLKPNATTVTRVPAAQ